MSADHHCPRCLATFHEDEFGVDHDGYLICLHVCDRRVLARAHDVLPPYQHRTAQFGMMLCGRCRKEIKRRRRDQKWCMDCSYVVRKEQDAERWRRSRGAA